MPPVDPVAPPPVTCLTGIAAGLQVMVSTFKVPDWSTTTNMVVIDGVKSSVTVPEAWFGVSVTSDTSTPPGRLWAQVMGSTLYT